jgi:hypothetical protein
MEDVTDEELVQLSDQHRSEFDIAWARSVLLETLKRMKRQCLESGRADVFGVFESRIMKPLFEQTEPMPYDQLIRQFDLQSPTQASNLLITAKRMFGRILRSVIAEYAHDDAEVEQEIQDLKAVLFQA